MTPCRAQTGNNQKPKYFFIITEMLRLFTQRHMSKNFSRQNEVLITLSCYGHGWLVDTLEVTINVPLLPNWFILQSCTIKLAVNPRLFVYRSVKFLSNPACRAFNIQLNGCRGVDDNTITVLFLTLVLRY